METKQRMVAAWWRVFRNQRLTARSVLLTAMEGGDATTDLRAVLQDVAPSIYPGAYSAHKLGRWLARMDGHEVDVDGVVYTFVDRGTVDSGRTWQLMLLVDVGVGRAVAEEALPTEFLDAAG